MFINDLRTSDNGVQNVEELEFQLFRMQENMKNIAKEAQVMGIDQTKEDKWVIVYSKDDGNSCRVMISDCETAYKGIWDFSIQAVYQDDETIKIGDIKGPSNLGYGSICMSYLKEIARNQNIPYITGDLAERDWDHLNRLIHFYKKHHFQVYVDRENKSGEIVWNDGF